jgi:predicted permease
MSWWSRFANAFRSDRLNREIDEELALHIEEAIEQGRDAAEAQRAFGSLLRRREASRDIRVITWLDSLLADAVFGWRQLLKNKASSAVAILSLALAMGACTSAFRLLDALLLRPLPVTAPERLYVVDHRGTDFDGTFQTSDGWMYPLFREMRATVKDQAETIATSYASRNDLTYGSDQEAEKAYVQYVSGWMFHSFGLRPALGRLLTENDDLKPNSHPVAVLSYDYWTRRFGRNTSVLGRPFHFRNELYTIVGVSGDGFTGIEPGKMTDIFVPTMMNPNVEQSDVNWFRMLVQLKPGVAVEPVRERLQAVWRSFREEQIKSLTRMPKRTLDGIVNQKVLLESAAGGVSDMQEEYGRPLVALGVLVALVLLIACANVANLMMAQAAARAREMALRVSIGAGRSRLVQLVVVESSMLAIVSSAIGGVFAWWSAPFVVSRISPPDNPARLVLPADWRVLSFGIILTVLVALLFGIAPALRASMMKPAAALKGGQDLSGSTSRSHRRLTCVLTAIQAAFCFLVLFVAGLFIATLDRLSRQPTGFSADRLVTFEVVAQREQPSSDWDEVAEHLQTLSGVNTVALAGWPLLSEHAEGGYISVDGSRPFADPAFFLDVSPGWMKVMGISFTAGREFRAEDIFPKTAIVNEAFVKQFLNGGNALGRTFMTALEGTEQSRVGIVGVVRNARYVTLRGPMPPVAYFPFHAINGKGAPRPRNSGTFIVRTISSNPLALAPAMRREISHIHPEFRVSNIRTQEEINSLHTMQERLIAILALFFATIALLLSGVGLYGVLHYSVTQRRREIGIRMAIGAQASHICRAITSDSLLMVVIGAVAGFGLGMASLRYIETLLYRVNPTDPFVLAIPSLSIIAAALLAAIQPLIHAMRIDPVELIADN